MYDSLDEDYQTTCPVEIDRLIGDDVDDEIEVNTNRSHPLKEVECSRIPPVANPEEATSEGQTTRPDDQGLSTIYVKPAAACFDLTNACPGNFWTHLLKIRHYNIKKLLPYIIKSNTNSQGKNEMGGGGGGSGLYLSFSLETWNDIFWTSDTQIVFLWTINNKRFTCFYSCFRRRRKLAILLLLSINLQKLLWSHAWFKWGLWNFMQNNLRKGFRGHRLTSQIFKKSPYLCRFLKLRRSTTGKY